MFYKLNKGSYISCGESQKGEGERAEEILLLALIFVLMYFLNDHLLCCFSTGLMLQKASKSK